MCVNHIISLAQLEVKMMCTCSLDAGSEEDDSPKPVDGCDRQHGADSASQSTALMFTLLCLLTMNVRSFK